MFSSSESTDTDQGIPLRLRDPAAGALVYFILSFFLWFDEMVYYSVKDFIDKKLC